jgi:hypothetical protein
MPEETQDPPSTGRPLRSETGFMADNINQSNKSKKDTKKPKL